MKHLSAVVITICALLCIAGAQTAPAHNHAVPVTVIKGTEHPELISDSLAIRLYALVAAPLDGDDAVTVGRKNDELSRVRLNGQDTYALTAQLMKFRKDFQKFTDDYNKKVQAIIQAGGDATASYKDLIIHKEAMSKQLQTDIQQSLSAEGAARFDRFIQNEKTHMTISTQ